MCRILHYNITVAVAVQMDQTTVTPYCSKGPDHDTFLNFFRVPGGFHDAFLTTCQVKSVARLWLSQTHVGGVYVLQFESSFLQNFSYWC